MSRPLSTQPINKETTQPVSAAVKSADDVIYHDDGLLAVAGPIMGLCYGLLFTTAAVTFSGTGSAAFVVLISIAFALVYFAVPVLMFRTRRTLDRRWRKDTDATAEVVDVWTGPMRRWEAVVQIISIPVAIVTAFVFLCFWWSGL